jgi:polar amino acid transport system substrate-binding protein
LTHVRLAFDPDFAPFSCLEAERPAGRAVDIVRSACDRAGIVLEFVPVGLGGRGAADDRLDGFACMAVTSGRTDLTFSAPYLTTSAALFFARASAVRGGGGPPDAIAVVTPQAGPLFGLLAGRIAAATSPIAAASLKVRVDGHDVAIARVVPGTDYRQCLRRVLEGEVDAAALNAEAGRALAARLFPGVLCEVPAPLDDLRLAVALRCDRAAASAVLALLDPALEVVAADVAAATGAAEGQRS